MPYFEIAFFLPCDERVTIIEAATDDEAMNKLNSKYGSDSVISGCAETDEEPPKENK